MSLLLAGTASADWAWNEEARTRSERPEKSSWASREGAGVESEARQAATKVLPVDDCEWAPNYAYGGLNGPVYAQAVFDDGGGEALYVGGDFFIAGGVHVGGIAKWDGTAWSALGSGMDDVVFALTTFDDGSGEALYAGGYFTTAGGVLVGGIAKWDGTSWSALGTGVDDSVFALTVFDDGSGAALFVGGYFSAAGGVIADNIAKWDGTSWSALGLGVDDEVDALTVFDDGLGAGPALYAGGYFEFAGGAPADFIAMWDGASWSPVGLGMDGPVLALAVFDDGSGAALFAGGLFMSAGGGIVFGVAQWDGTTWSDLDGGLDAPALSLTVFNDGSGDALYVGGIFFGAGPIPASGVARWNGTSWSALGTGLRDAGEGPEVISLGVFDDGGGATLFAGGYFHEAGDLPAAYLASWDGASWLPVAASGPNFQGMDDVVFATVVFDDGSGPALYAGGGFVTAGGVPVHGIAKWDGASWSALGSGMSCLGFPGMGGGGEGGGGKGIVIRLGCDFPSVEALAVYDDGGGPALYAGGLFDFAGGVPAANIAKWDGASWSPLGSGTTDIVEALAVYDDGGGADLYAGGEFDLAGFELVFNIARWDGAAWSEVDGGADDDVETLAVYDDGGGADLYAGGEFNLVGGVVADYIARWDGTSWSALGLGTDDEVEALLVYDDGDGADLYVGGLFGEAGGVPNPGIARWDGVAWSGLGSGVSRMGGGTPRVEAMAVFNDGQGPDLYAGGKFDAADGVLAANMARWDGAAWSALGVGTNEEVETLAVFNVNGPSLYAGGFFDEAGGFASSYIGEWRCPAAEVSIDDVTLAEGNAGTTDFVFTLSRTHNATAVSVDLETADGSASTGSDYTALPPQTVSFAADGALSMMVTVEVVADTIEEAPSKDFFVDLSSPAAATILDGQGVGTILDDDDDGPPAVMLIDSTTGTGDGVLSECEEARVAVSQLQVTFDRRVHDPAGDSAASDATNPDSYRLFAAGADRDITSTTCGPPADDDVLVMIDAVTYDDVTRTATVALAGGFPLADGPHRLVVCDSITDPAGNALAGGDFTRTFRIERDNLFINGHLDCDLGGWTLTSTDPGEIAHSGVDVDAALVSGSGLLTNLTSSTQFSLSQCLPASGGAGYELSGSVQMTAAVDVTLLVGRTCEFFAAAACAGASLGAAVDVLPLSDTAGVWQSLTSGFTAPETAASMRCGFDFAAPEGEAFSAHLDDLELLGSELSLFADGFESGNTLAWSLSSP